jgi:glucose-6-phosphate isomerase
MSTLTRTAEWKVLQQLAVEIKKKSLAELFSTDSKRFTKFSLTQAGLTLDYSKNPITKKILSALFKLADKLVLKQNIDALFSGECVNITEKLPALHTALRDPRTSNPMLKQSEILPNIHAALAKMQTFVEQIHNRTWLGATQKPITDIINLGIGGSNLGPLMAFNALRTYHASSLRFHFISNVDSKAIELLLNQLNPETSLFIIASKSFATLETLINAKLILSWMKTKIPNKKQLAQHFLAITARSEKAVELGIAEQNIFPLWDWVVGRFSLCSCIGLPVAIAIGMQNFREFLRGAHAMDQHFLHARWEENMPVLLGLLAIWQRNFFQTQAHIILPYAEDLAHFPAYLQQLEMESNGKSIRIDNKSVDYATCPFIFGELGINGQHAFYQLFHQGTAQFSADFIFSLENATAYKRHHQHVIASALGQSKAFMEGHIDAIAYKTLAGNHASNVLALDKLTPFNLGLLIALYEHKVFVQSVIWQINPFDQWGVEYGKKLNQSIYRNLGTAKNSNGPMDSSTQGLIDLYRALNNI